MCSGLGFKQSCGLDSALFRTRVVHKPGNLSLELQPLSLSRCLITFPSRDEGVQIGYYVLLLHVASVHNNLCDGLSRATLLNSSGPSETLQ